MKSIRTLLAIAAVFAFGLSALQAEVASYTVRGGLPNFINKLKGTDDVRISYFGGSITAGAGSSKPQFCYRELLSEWLKKDNPGAKITSYNAAIGGTGSWLGAFRCWTDVGYMRPDLVIVEFAVNDGGAQEDQVIAAMEGIVRQLRTKTPSKPDILFVYTMVKDHLEAFKAGKLPPTMQYHEKVAEHYGIPSVCMAKLSAEKVNSGEMTMEAFAKDNVHPTDAGYAIYLKALKPFFAEMKKNPGAGAPALPQPLSPKAMENAKLVSYDWAQLDEGWLGWQLSPTSSLPHLAVSDKPGATITLKFKGSQVGLFDMIGPDTGNLEYSLNGEPWKHKVNFDKYCLTYARAHAAPLIQNLDPTKEHELKVRIAEDTPAGSKGRFTRLGYFLVDGVVKDPDEGKDPLTKIDGIYATMKPVTWTAPETRWANLGKTKEIFNKGPQLNMVMLGDSIIGDTCGSQFEYLLQRNYPKCKVNKIVSVRGSTGCWYYKTDNHVEEYVLRHKPDLLVIGGISQRDDTESIREVIRQTRAKMPNVEVLLISPVFGAPTNKHNAKWTPEPDSTYGTYRIGLKKLAEEEKCGFFDMTGPWWEYIQTSGYALNSFKRDPIHANDRGKQILGRLMEKFLAP